jgi:L-ascorbate metabolism protein UlaG (beta-lactamase superfamily)
MNPLTQNIHWLAHASFRIDADDLVVYIDPWQLNDDAPPADLILITHDHSDHCSPDDVARVQTEETVIVTIEAAAKKLDGTIEIVKPGDHLTVKGVAIETVPAYNLTKFRSPGNPFHPKSAGHAGFIITLGSTRIYHTGDVDVIPEMKEIQTDVALLPISGTYVMTADEAIEAAELIQPKVVVPMHIGRGIGSLEMIDLFQRDCPIPVEVLPLEND